MRGEDLYRAIGAVDDELLLRSERRTAGFRFPAPVMRFVPALAVFLIAALVFTPPLLQRMGRDNSGNLSENWPDLQKYELYDLNAVAAEGTLQGGNGTNTVIISSPETRDLMNQLQDGASAKKITESAGTLVQENGENAELYRIEGYDKEEVFLIIYPDGRKELAIKKEAEPQ